ncbi:Rieske 2Fe-2S domain-containing protein [Streptomyces sp. BE20]|uniref:Rieske 2Fe-2S domain-containing protein n=1 Tax=Streptomyces sp. BE20 TaxID=3002525 RepID=UPI003FA7E095
MRAVDPSCPHLGGHLAVAKGSRRKFSAPLHAFVYGPDGSRIRAPQSVPPRLGARSATNTAAPAQWDWVPSPPVRPARKRCPHPQSLRPQAER